MSARTFKYANRLAKMVSPHKGLNRRQATDSAQRQLEVVRGQSLEAVAAAVQQISTLAVQISRPDDAEAEAVYDAGNRIIAVAGLFGLEELGEAAYSLCELVTRLRAAETWNAAMVAVHVDALQILRSPENHPPELRQALLQGLRRLLDELA